MLNFRGVLLGTISSRKTSINQSTSKGSTGKGKGDCGPVGFERRGPTKFLLR